MLTAAQILIILEIGATNLTTQSLGTMVYFG
jgi:hypothetical protein